MKDSIACAALLLFLSSCAIASPKASDISFRAEALAELTNAPVAVLPFQNATDFLGADFLVTDEFNLRAGMRGMFRLVERERVKELYREQDFDPSRIGDSEAAAIGRMLGAKAVFLGTVTNYKSSNRPPEIPLDAFPIDMPKETTEEILAWALVNTVAAAIAVLTMKEPVAEVGMTVRLVNTETGEIVWQARDAFVGDEKRLQARFERETWSKMREDVVYLTSLLATDLAGTLPGGIGTDNAR